MSNNREKLSSGRLKIGSGLDRIFSNPRDIATMSLSLSKMARDVSKFLYSMLDKFMIREREHKKLIAALKEEVATLRKLVDENRKER